MVCIDAIEYYSAIKRNECISRHINMDNLENMLLSEKKPVTKDHIFYDSMYMKCTDLENLGKQKVGRREGEGGNVE